MGLGLLLGLAGADSGVGVDRLGTSSVLVGGSLKCSVLLGVLVRNRDNHGGGDGLMVVGSLVLSWNVVFDGLIGLVTDRLGFVGKGC